MTRQQPTTRRERRIAARRQQIMEAALNVFAEKGFHQATTREIAEAADVAEGTIYNYFESKEDLLFTFLDEVADMPEREAVLEAGLGGDIRETVLPYFKQRLTRFLPVLQVWTRLLPDILNTPTLRQRYTEIIIEPMMTLLENHLQARVDRGELQPFNVSLTVRLLIGGFFGLQVLTLLEDPVIEAAWEDDPAHLIDTLARIFIEGALHPLEKRPSAGDEGDESQG